jgi:CRP-like cAMP-binding protein
MDIIAAKEVLSRWGWLEATDPAFRGALLSRASLHQLERGDPIYRQLDQPGGIWGVAEGSAIVDFSSEREGFALAPFGPGTWFGEGALISRGPRLIGVVAACPSTLLHVSLSDLQALVSQEPGWWRWIAYQALVSTQHGVGLVSDLQIRQPRERVAAILLRLSANKRMMVPLPQARFIAMTQEQLAECANVSRTVISQLLAEFVAAGAVTLRYRRIEIDDPKILARFA